MGATNVQNLLPNATFKGLYQDAQFYVRKFYFRLHTAEVQDGGHEATGTL